MKRLILISALFMGTSSLVSAAPCKTVPECHKHLKAMAVLLKQDEEELKKITAELEEAKASAVSSSSPKTASAKGKKSASVENELSMGDEDEEMEESVPAKSSRSSAKPAHTKGAKKAPTPVEAEDEPLEEEAMGDEDEKMEESMPAKSSRSSAKPAPTKGAKKAEAPVEEEDEPLEEEVMGDEETEESVPEKSSGMSGKTPPAPKKKGGACSSVAECHRDLKEMAGHLRADAEEIQQLEDEITELQEAMETCTGSTRIEFTDEEKRVSSVGHAWKKEKVPPPPSLEEKKTSPGVPPPPAAAPPPPPPPNGGKATHPKGGESKKSKAPHEEEESAGEGRGALLAAIHKGAKLRKTDGPAERDALGNKIERDDAPASPEKSGKVSTSKASSENAQENAHLAAIHKGIKLRKTDGPAERNAKGEKIDKSGKPVKAIATGSLNLQETLLAHFQKTRPQIADDDEEDKNENENENQEDQDW